jgi:hypothetical protein
MNALLNALEDLFYLAYAFFVILFIYEVFGVQR